MGHLKMSFREPQVNQNNWRTIRKARRGPDSQLRAWSKRLGVGALCLAFGAWFGYWIAGAF